MNSDTRSLKYQHRAVMSTGDGGKYMSLKAWARYIAGGGRSKYSNIARTWLARKAAA